MTSPATPLRFQWREFATPTRPAARTPVATSAAGVAARWWIVAGPALVVPAAAASTAHPAAGRVAVAVAAALFALAARSHALRQPAVALLAGAAVAAGIGYPALGATAAASLAVGVLGTVLSLHRPLARVGPGRALPDAPAVQVAVVTAACLTGRITGLAWLTLALQLAGVAVHAAPSGVRAGLARIDNLGARGGLALLDGVVRVVTGALVAALLVPTWLLDRVLGWDPLWFRHEHGSRWVARHVQLTDSRRTWSPRTSLRPTALRRLAPVVLRLGVVVLVVLLSLPVTVPFVVERVTGGAPALADSPWLTEQSIAEAVSWERSTYSSFLGPTLADVDTPYLRIVDGRRQSWRPPAEPTVTIWFFGGSTMFGQGQRDDHTIASEVARAAWRDGLAVEAVNFGVPGDVAWMEHQRLRAALASGQQRPDLVVFYDGWNDLLSHAVDPTTDASAVPFRGTLDPLLADRGVGWFEDLFLSACCSFASSPPRGTTPLTDADRLDAAVAQYSEATARSRSLLEEAGIETVAFLQPTRATRSVPRSDEEGSDGAHARAAAREFEDRRPAGVISLTSVMDRVEGPIYWDGGHTNERGAAVVAAAMLPHLRTALPHGEGPS